MTNGYNGNPFLKLANLPAIATQQNWTIVCFCLVSVNFNEPSYSADEGQGQVCPTLMLTMPAPIDATIEINYISDTAQGKLNRY